MRYAKRLADRLHAPLTALCIETARSQQLSEEERDRIADTLRLAERLGGEAITIPAGARHIADDVINFAHANNVTQIVMGKSTRPRWFEILHGSVVHDLVRRCGNISVHVIAGDALDGAPFPKRNVRTADQAPRFRSAALSGRHPWRLRSRSVVGQLIQHFLAGIENVDLVFLTAIVVIAVRYGLLAIAAGQRRRIAVL